LNSIGRGVAIPNPSCPAPSPAAPAPSAGVPPPNPEALAVNFWRIIPLPVARPSIPPGYAITGKVAYLVTGGTTTPAPFVENTPIGALTIRAEGQYLVDWGDQEGSADTWSGPYATDGQPWPNGQITHVYDIAGTYTVTVREEWSAVWHLAGASGTLNGLATTADIPAFRAEQLQAVVINPTN
jgi:hypothetical protein